jgi:hypothetical protein
MSERREAFMRIVVGIVSGIILSIWKALVIVLSVFHWLYAIFTKKRNKGIAEFCNGWVNYVYTYYRYMAFTTNNRPFPFGDLKKAIEPIEMKTPKEK